MNDIPEPPAPLAGGTAVQPSTAPAEVAAGYSQEGSSVSPASLGSDESDRGQPYLETPALPSDPAARAAVSPATGEREAELRALIQATHDKWQIDWNRIYDQHKTASAYKYRPVLGYPSIVEYILAALTPLLDRREGALRRELDNVQEALTPLVQLVERHTLESDESFETEDVLESHYAELVKLRAEREQWRLSSVCREKEAELAVKDAEIARLTRDRDDFMEQLDSAIQRQGANTVALTAAQSALREAEADAVRRQASGNALYQRIVELCGELWPKDTRDLEWDVLPGSLAAKLLEQRSRIEKVEADLHKSEAARGEDSKRLDWLEAQRVQCGFDPGQPPIGFEGHYGPEPGYPPRWSLGVGQKQIAEQETLRAAIDEARKLP